MKHIIKSLFLALCVLGLLTPSSTEAFWRKKKKNKKIPEWVLSRPVDSDYYIGIGIAKKNGIPDYLSRAKSNALQDLASEIEVKLEASTIFRQIEENEALSESFSSIIKSSIKDDLEGYELVDSYENEYEARVYYRISKEEYQARKRRKVEDARSEASSFFRKGEFAEEEKNITVAIRNYVNAIYAVRGVISENVSIFTDEGKKEVVSASLEKLRNIVSNIDYKYEKNPTGEEKGKFVVLAIYKRQHKVSDLPLKIGRNTSKNEKKMSALTNAHGIVSELLSEPKQKYRKFSLEIALNKFYKKPINESDREKVFLAQKILETGVIVPIKTITLSTKQVNLFFVSKEKKKGKVAPSQRFSRSLKRILSEQNFVMSLDREKSEYEIIVALDSEESKIDNNLRLVKVVLFGTITINNLKTNESIFSYDLDNVSATQPGGDYRAAYSDAYDELIELGEDEIINSILEIGL